MEAVTTPGRLIVARLPAPSRLDIAIAVAVAVLAELELWLADIPGPRALSAAVSLLLGLALAWRRSAPLVVALAVVCLLDTEILAGVPKNGPSAPLLAIVLAMYSLGARGSTRSVVAGGALALIIAWIGIVSQPPLDATDLPYSAMLGLAPLVLGRALGATQRDAEQAAHRAEQAAQRAERAEHERERAPAEAIADERARIARELHDVVSHSISVMGVQAGGVRRLLPPGNEELELALRSVEETGREVLGEMRRLLGIVRGAEEPSLSPQPGLARVDELVSVARSASLSVELHAAGLARSLPAGLDLAAYRIVQEALTNVRRHAPGARAKVTIRRTEHELEILVTDDGPGLGGNPGAGHGLIGMRERIALYDGELELGDAPGGGCRLRASLPIWPLNR